MIYGGWRRRRDARFGPYFTFVLVLFAFSALVSAVHVPGGTFIHSAVALIPHAYVLALEGIVAGTVLIAARRPRWNADQAARVFVGAAVGFTVVVAVAGSFVTHAQWEVKRERMQAVAAALSTADPSSQDRVMSIDASGYKYWTGHPGVVLVNDPLETVEEVARAYAIRWLVVERADSVPAVAGVMDDTARPAWVGPSLLARDDIGLYPVCLDTADTRCTPR
jgi:hypothetical protein